MIGVRSNHVRPLRQGMCTTTLKYTIRLYALPYLKCVFVRPVARLLLCSFFDP